MAPEAVSDGGPVVDQLKQGSHRVNLRVRTDTYDLIKRLAVHKETSAAGFVQGLLEDMHPRLVELLATLDSADHVQTVDQGVNVLDQLRTMAVHARSEADRLDAMVDVWQQQVRDAGERGSDARAS
jgi:hypothetical protein